MCSSSSNNKEIKTRKIMEILSDTPRLLTHYEVLEALKCPALARYPTFSLYRKYIRDNSKKKSYKPLSNIKHDINDLKSYSVELLYKLDDTAWVKEKVLSYLENKPCKAQDMLIIQKFVQNIIKLTGKINDFSDYNSTSLTRGELLQLIDIRPENEVELEYIIQMLHDRLDETIIQQILTCIKTDLPDPTTIKPTKKVNSPRKSKRNNKKHHSDEDDSDSNSNDSDNGLFF